MPNLAQEIVKPPVSRFDGENQSLMAVYRGMTTLAAERRAYQSYLLRLWESKEEGKHVWRASLEIPGTGERQGFPTLQALFVFLEEQTGEAEGQDRESMQRRA